MPAKATRSSTTRRSRFSLWLLWKAISGGHTQGAVWQHPEVTEVQVTSYSSTNCALLP